jgi:hypothetical protein
MASFLYDNYCNLMLGNGTHTLPDLDANEIRVGIVSGSDYTESQTTHQDWADVGTYTEDVCYNSEATQVLSNKDVGTTTARVFDNTADITFTAVSQDAAKVVDAIVHYAATGTDLNDDPLICFHDGFSSVTPNGGDIVIAYNASGIFGL